MMKKKKWAPLVSLALAVSLVAGCSSTPSEPAESPVSGSPKTADAVTIKFYADGISFKKEDLDPVIAKFQEKNPGIWSSSSR